jgi:neutral ceramidase
LKHKFRYLISALVLLGFIVIFPYSRADNSLKVGIARQDITPAEPVPMWGYSSRHASLSEGVLDPLYASAMVLQLEGKKIAIVSLDLGRAPAEKSLENIRRRIKSKAGIEHSFIAASHTHHGPVLELSDEKGKGQGRFDGALRYYRQMEDSIVQAILQANESLQPAKMGGGAVQLEEFNMNRQSGFPHPPSDRDLAVLRFDDLSGKPIAILVNFAAHPTMVSELNLKFSADYVGAMKQLVEKETGASVLFIQGAAGDQSPNDLKDYVGFGQDLGREVIKFNAKLQTQLIEHPTLKVREERFKFKSRLHLEDSGVRKQSEKVFFPELIANYAEYYAQGVQPRLTVAVLGGEIALVGVSGEFFSSHAIRLKERARMKELLFFGYCNGYDQYFPTIEAVAESGYGTENTSAPAAVGAGENLMDTALVWIYEMRGEIAPAPQ